MRVADGERFDYGVDLGGFLVKDRLWFFGAYNRVTLQGDVLASSGVDATSRRDDLSRSTQPSNLYSGKLTWNVASSTTIVGTVFADPSDELGAAGPTRGRASAPATCRLREPRPVDLVLDAVAGRHRLRRPR